MGNIWRQLSNEISESVALAGQSVVAVDGRAGHTSSGIVWRPEHVLTAAHAIRHDAGITVILQTGKSIQARLAGRAPGSDIAVLKLDQAVDSKVADFGATASLAVGELVIAVARTRRGNLVASSGILGGLMGEWQTGRVRIDQFIRPDLTLYPGFSGGALIGHDGKILGMTTSGLLRGKAITIPASTLSRVAEEIVAKGHVATPYIGLVMQPVQLPESLRKTSGLSATTGLLVMHVEPSGPSDGAGVLLGDILVSLDNQGFDALEDLQDVLLKRGINQEVKATLVRAGQKLELTIRIGERPIR